MWCCSATRKFQYKMYGLLWVGGLGCVLTLPPVCHGRMPRVDPDPWAIGQCIGMYANGSMHTSVCPRPSLGELCKCGSLFKSIHLYFHRAAGCIIIPSSSLYHSHHHHCTTPITIIVPLPSLSALYHSHHHHSHHHHLNQALTGLH